MTMLVQDVTVTYRDRTLVDVPEVHLEPGRPVTIVGESGSGKSLLAHAVMGTSAPGLRTRGRMVLDGSTHDLADRRHGRRLWGSTLALLPQEPALALDPTMRVREQVAEGHPVFTRSRGTALAAATARLTSLGLGDQGRSYPHTLSGGMAQRVAFAAATVGGAPVLLADEPSTGLDATARAALADLLRRHCADGGMLLTITHDLDLARELGGQVLVMREAAVVERGEAVTVLSEPTHPYTRRLLGAEPRAWQHPWMRPGPPVPDAAAVLTATGLSKGFDRGPLFEDVDLTVRAGDRWALTGPSGSGKTTLGNVLLGLAAPDTGQVTRAPGIAPGRVQKLYQDPGASFPARVPLTTSFRDVLRRHGVPATRLDGLLTELRLPGSMLERRPGEVSGGELQRLAIIRAMLLDPVLLFADEPTSRLDLVTQEETISCLMTQVAERDCALVLVTHDHTLAHAVADHTLPVGDRGPALTPTGSR